MENKKWTRNEIIDVLESIEKDNDLDSGGDELVKELLSAISGEGYISIFEGIKSNISTLEEVVESLKEVDDEYELAKTQATVLEDLINDNKQLALMFKEAIEEANDDSKKDN